MPLRCIALIGTRASAHAACQLQCEHRHFNTQHLHIRHTPHGNITVLNPPVLVPGSLSCDATRTIWHGIWSLMGRAGCICLHVSPILNIPHRIAICDRLCSRPISISCSPQVSASRPGWMDRHDMARDRQSVPSFRRITSTVSGSIDSCGCGSVIGY